MAETPKKRRTTKKKAAVLEEKPVVAEEQTEVTTSQSEIVTSQVEEEETMVPKIVEMPPTKCTWRKSVGSSIRLTSGRKVKPNEVFDAFPYEIPEAFKDMFELVSGDPTVVERIQVSPSKFAIGVREDGMYDVCDDEGVAINDEPLDEVDAQRLLIALTT